MRTIALEEHFWTASLAAAPGTGPLATRLATGAWGWPAEAGRRLLDTLPLSPDDVAKIADGNAERVLGLRPLHDKTLEPSAP